MSNYFGKGHTLYIYNYQNSIRLTKYLLDNKTKVKGTSRKNRKENPKEIMKKKIKKRGSSSRREWKNAVFLRFQPNIILHFTSVIEPIQYPLPLQLWTLKVSTLITGIHGSTKAIIIQPSLYKWTIPDSGITLLYMDSSNYILIPSNDDRPRFTLCLWTFTSNHPPPATAAESKK